MAPLTREVLHEEFATLRSDVSKSNNELKEDVKHQLRRFLDSMRDSRPQAREGSIGSSMTKVSSLSTTPRPLTRQAGDNPLRQPGDSHFTSARFATLVNTRESTLDKADETSYAWLPQPSPRPTTKQALEENRPRSKESSRMNKKTDATYHPRVKGAKTTFTPSLPTKPAPLRQAAVGDVDMEVSPIFETNRLGRRLSGTLMDSTKEGRPESRKLFRPVDDPSNEFPDLPFAVQDASFINGEHQINIIESGHHTAVKFDTRVSGFSCATESEEDDVDSGEDSDDISSLSFTPGRWKPTFYNGDGRSRKASIATSVGCVRPSLQAVSCWLPQQYQDAEQIQARQTRRLSLISEKEDRRSSAYLVWKGKLSLRAAFWGFCESDYFDYFMGVFLVLNAIMIGVGVDVVTSLRDEGKDETPIWLRVVDLVFCFIFLMELSIRIAMYNVNFFTMKGKWWNIFDVFVVGFSVIDEISKAFLTGTKLQEAIDQLGILRLLRLARVLRLIRLVRMIPELKSMVYLIASSMGAFFWAVMLLLIMIYCIAVYLTELSDEIIKKQLVTSLDDLKLFYGSVGSSIFTCFQAITGGDDWKVFVEIFKEQSPSSFFMNSFLFSLYIGFATMVMLNLVTGVFVDGAQRIIREEKEAEIVKNVRNLFHMTDSDQSGEVSWEEFQAQLESSRMSKYLLAVDMDPSEAKALFKLLDTDRSGELSVEEFVDGCLRFRLPARSIDINSLKYDFHDITSVWASQFAIIDTNIKVMLDLQTKIAQSLVTSAITLPEETYVV